MSRATDLDAANDLLEETRRRISKAIRMDRDKILGGSAWLANAITDDEIILDHITDDAIWFRGVTWTSQTMSHEHFDGCISWDQLDAADSA